MTLPPAHPTTNRPIQKPAERPTDDTPPSNLGCSPVLDREMDGWTVGSAPFGMGAHQTTAPHRYLPHPRRRTAHAVGACSAHFERHHPMPLRHEAVVAAATARGPVSCMANGWETWRLGPCCSSYILAVDAIPTALTGSGRFPMLVLRAETGLCGSSGTRLRRLRGGAVARAEAALAELSGDDGLSG